MPPIDDAGSRADEANDATPAPPPDFPRYVRWLAAAYVLSQLVGPAGFVVLGATAAFVWARRHLTVDGVALGLALAALACPLACAAFRWWFKRWGRRRWPPAGE